MNLSNVASGQPRFGVISGDAELITAIDFSPDGLMFATGSIDRSAKIYDAATGRQICMPLQLGDRVNVVRFTPDGRSLITGSRDRTLRVWDLSSLVRRQELILPHPLPPSATRSAPMDARFSLA